MSSRETDHRNAPANSPDSAPPYEFHETGSQAYAETEGEAPPGAAQEGDLRLAELMVQRLCHDLVNPFGAVLTGLELLELQQPRSQETALMHQSLTHGLGRIRLYRLALGAADEGMLARGEIERALSALGGSRPLELSAALPAALPRREARLLLLMGLCLETALAWGGRLEVEASPGGRIRLCGIARRIRLEETELWTALLRGERPERPTARHLHFALLPGAAADCARRVRVEPGAGRLVLEA